MAFYLSNDRTVLYEGTENYSPSIYHEITKEEADTWRNEVASSETEPEPTTPAPLVYDNETLTAAMLALTEGL